jgi:sugar lactone lactonase YvrE
LDGAIGVHADLNGIADFHCNDMVVDAQGNAYVGNFGFDLDGELATRGDQSVIADHPTARLACVLPDGTVRVAAADMHFPNGTVITPDGKNLIIGETLSGCLTAFDVAPDGTLSGRRVWAPTWPRIPDGIALDAKGHIWIANALAPECALIAEGGEVLEVIDTGQHCYACMLGGEDGRSLFMLTAPTSVGREARATPQGKLLVATVDTPHAGRP